MTVSRLLSAIVLVFAVSLMLVGCETLRGDRKVETEPQEGSDKGRGIFTGRKGGFIIESDLWTGASPSGDTEDGP